MYYALKLINNYNKNLIININIVTMTSLVTNGPRHPICQIKLQLTER